MHKRTLKQIALATLSLSFVFNAHATGPGFYMGIMGGPATNSGGQKTIQVFPLPTATSPKAITGLANPKSTQFGSRLFLGYKLMNNVGGFELGFVYFSGINYIINNSNLRPAGGTTFRVRAIDLVGKLDYSFQNTIGVFAKAGVAAYYTTTPGALNVTNYHVVTTRNRGRPNQPPSVQVINSGSNTYTTKLGPTFSLGISYDLTPNWVTDLSWTNYMVGGVVGNVSLYAIGLSYHFVDIYCGQFLCDD